MKTRYTILVTAIGLATTLTHLRAEDAEFPSELQVEAPSLLADVTPQAVKNDLVAEADRQVEEPGLLADAGRHGPPGQPGDDRRDPRGERPAARGAGPEQRGPGGPERSAQGHPGDDRGPGGPGGPRPNERFAGGEHPHGPGGDSHRPEGGPSGWCGPGGERFAARGHGFNHDGPVGPGGPRFDQRFAGGERQHGPGGEFRRPEGGPRGWGGPSGERFAGSGPSFHHDGPSGRWSERFAHRQQGGPGAPGGPRFEQSFAGGEHQHGPGGKFPRPEGGPRGWSGPGGERFAGRGPSFHHDGPIGRWSERFAHHQQGGPGGPGGPRFEQRFAFRGHHHHGPGGWGGGERFTARGPGEQLRGPRDGQRFAGREPQRGPAVDQRRPEGDHREPGAPGNDRFAARGPCSDQHGPAGPRPEPRAGNAGPQGGPSGGPERDARRPGGEQPGAARDDRRFADGAQRGPGGDPRRFEGDRHAFGPGERGGEGPRAELRRPEEFRDYRYGPRGHAAWF